MLLGTIGLSNSGISLLAPSQANLIKAINVLEPTTNLLYKYNPAYTCLLVGAKYLLDHGGYEAPGGNGRSLVLDAGSGSSVTTRTTIRRTCPSSAPRAVPAASRAAGRCPTVKDNWPVRQLITNTGFGTGVDWRPNPGIGFPGYVNYLPVTRAVPEPPSIRNLFGGPAPGPIPYPGAPAYGAPTVRPGRHAVVAGTAAGTSAGSAAGSGSDAGIGAVRGAGARATTTDAVAADSATAVRGAIAVTDTDRIRHYDRER